MKKIKNNILESSREKVLKTMEQINFFTQNDIKELKKVKIGFLRKNAVYRHGVTRFLPTKKWNKINADPSCVRIVDIHPLLIENEWETYREIIIYHEFIHCLGYIGHDKSFYKIEALWPTINQKEILGQKFMNVLKLKNSKWKWKCNKCQIHVLRQKKSSGRYICRKCNSKLIDEMII
ncbi:MAG: hypothetical protein CMB64_00815 [Euryarchaeota archaeon]|nr:hypothetical protein [Euryarchaeota archaeon]